MYFENIYLNNFGSLSNLNIDFKEKGLNVIYGNNESSKTQLIGAILLSIFGMDVINTQESSKVECHVKLTIKDGEYLQIIENRFYLNGLGKLKRDYIINLCNLDKNELYLNEELKKSIIDLRNPSLIHNDDLILKNIEESGKIKEYLNNNKFVERLDKRILDKIKFINEHTLNALSMGERTFIGYVFEYLKRMNSNTKIPLIINSPFVYLDKQNTSLLENLLIEIAKKNQVIILTNDYFYLFGDNVSSFTTLDSFNAKSMSPVYFNHKFNSYNNQKLILILNDYFMAEEDYDNEFKEIKGNNPIDSIKKNLPKFVVGVLNSESLDNGRIYWGVENQTKKIVGVNLSEKKRDEIKNIIENTLAQIKPSISPNSYSVDLIPIYDSNNSIMKDIWLIQVIIRKEDIEKGIKLFSTNEDIVYIRKNGSTIKLNSQQIQDETVLRIKKYGFKK